MSGVPGVLHPEGPGSLRGARAVVTGAARGIGQHVAYELARAGATVTVLDVLDPTHTVEHIEAEGGTAYGNRVDVTDRPALAAAIRTAATTPTAAAAAPTATPTGAPAPPGATTPTAAPATAGDAAPAIPTTAPTGADAPPGATTPTTAATPTATPTGAAAPPGAVTSAGGAAVEPGGAAGLDVLVTAAGVYGDTTSLDELGDDELGGVLSVNLAGTLWTVQAALPALRARRGRVVCIGSVAGKVGGVLAGPHYAASKGGVHAVVRWLAKTQAADGVTANGVAPGAVDTEMIAGRGYRPDYCPLGRFAQPEEIARVAAFLASPAASYVTGAVVDVNGGYFMG